ncbi:hypothetical protein [Prosthecomicrobium sp. N25]|uniref:hypothetical protein n=1 Tax=Prosthecomicrobium sp. N25 TaxID=3129254 RepID=UPI003076ACF4
MPDAPAPLDELPKQPNPNASGLFMTDDELRVLRDALAREPAIVRAKVYGSRQTGIRREKDPPSDLDIDLAIEIPTDDPEDAFTEFLEARWRLHAAPGLRLEVEDLTDAGSPRYAARQAGVLIFDRSDP